VANWLGLPWGPLVPVTITFPPLTTTPAALSCAPVTAYWADQSWAPLVALYATVA
jgi:hypothetical protein